MQKKKGISLIVLVITIIVMLVLAGAIIVTLINNGIIGRAQEAKDKASLNEVKVAANLLWSEAFLNNIRDQEGLEDAVINGLTAQKVDTTKYIITVTTSGVTVELKGEEEDDDDVVVGSGQLATPTIAINGNTLTITAEDENIQGYAIYVDGELKTTIEVTSYDMSTLGLEYGSYQIKVKAVADGSEDSEASAAVEYIIVPSQAAVTISLTNPVNAEYFGSVEIYDDYNYDTLTTDGARGNVIGNINSANGTATVTTTTGKICVKFTKGSGLLGGNSDDITISEEIELPYNNSGYGYYGYNEMYFIYNVFGDGTITIDKVDWNYSL